MEDNIQNKILIRQILKQTDISEFEFNWYIQHLSVDQLIEFLRIDTSEFNSD